MSQPWVLVSACGSGLKLTNPRPIPSFLCRKTVVSTISLAGDGNPIPSLQARSPNCSSLNQYVSSSPTTHLARNLRFRRTPELGLLSVLFVMLMAFRRLEISVDKLSKVVSKEVPGTLFSLKLSGLEINDLTRQLSNIRQCLSRTQHGKKERRKKT